MDDIEYQRKMDEMIDKIIDDCKGRRDLLTEELIDQKEIKEATIDSVEVLYSEMDSLIFQRLSARTREEAHTFDERIEHQKRLIWHRQESIQKFYAKLVERLTNELS